MGRRFIQLLDGQLQHLRGHAPHGNRCFFYDQLVVAHLLAFFNPILAGLRKIEDVFDVPAVRKRLKMPRVPKSTLADAQRLFDPELLLPLFESLKERAGIQEHDPRLDAITRRLLAVDGTFFAVAGRITWAIYNRSSKNNVTQGNVRAHVHLDILRGVPNAAEPPSNNASAGHKKTAANRRGRSTRRPGRLEICAQHPLPSDLANSNRRRSNAINQTSRYNPHPGNSRAGQYWLQARTTHAA